MLDKKNYPFFIMVLMSVTIVSIMAIQIFSNNESKHDKSSEVEKVNISDTLLRPYSRSNKTKGLPVMPSQNSEPTMGINDQLVEQELFISSVLRIFNLRPQMNTPTGKPMLRLDPGVRSDIFYELGFEKGDLLAKINDQSLDIENLEPLVAQFHKYEEVRLSVFREGYEIGLTINLNKIANK